MDRLLMAAVAVVGVPLATAGYVLLVEKLLQAVPDRRRRGVRPWLWLLPALALLTAFIVYPMAKTIVQTSCSQAGPTRCRSWPYQLRHEARSNWGVICMGRSVGRPGPRAGAARDGWRAFGIHPTSRYVSPGRVFVEGDASAASYFLAAGAIGGGPVRVDGVGRDSIQGDVRFVEVLERAGARVTMGESWIECASGGSIAPFDLDLNHVPDAAMTAAVLALFAKGTSTIRNVGSWRVKETDRLAAMATELRKLGATVEEGADFLRITPGAIASAATIDTYDDHRMAMSFSLACLAGVPVRINDPMCVAKTYPTFFDDFRRILVRAS